VIERTSEIADIKAQVLLITYDEPALLREKMAHDLDIPYPMLLDPDKQAYQRWGMGRTNAMGAMLSPALNVRYVKLLLKGERFLGLAPDMYQLGGDFVIDSQGRIAFAHTMRNNGDRAEVAILFQELRRTAAMAAE